MRKDSGFLISSLRKEGFRTVMLTGDNEAVASRVAGELGIGEYRSGLLPADKADAVDKIIGEKKGEGAVVFVGDGINDSPVIMRADIGVSMGGIGSDCAIEGRTSFSCTTIPPPCSKRERYLSAPCGS